MYAATYIGGSANLVAVALHYGVMDEPALFAATNVADGVVGTLWLAGLVVLVHLLHRLLGTRPVSLDGLGMLVSLAFGSLWAPRPWRFDDSTTHRTCSAEDLLVIKAFAARDQDWADVTSILERRIERHIGKRA